MPDRGYHDEDPSKVKTPSRLGDSRAQRKMRGKVHAGHETVNKRFRHFGVLNQRFRHDILDHGDVFRAVVVLTQTSIEKGEPLFSVDYKDK
mmetsp:Transcript_7568/g.11550  ORF Transcript_7568/g.11550 Transcript_7568/m.11550 type:complete len:91 (+) Transcript_7568:542-814(+)